MCRFAEIHVSDGGKAEVAGNDTLLGQVATFIDVLHLTYKEVFEVIPYRNLIIMQKDKLRPVYGEKMEEVSEEDYFKNKSKNK
jgi:hypothetical protein|nr:MAG TPA: hypothetical protein [Caudoviricetes sp.]